LIEDGTCAAGEPGVAATDRDDVGLERRIQERAGCLTRRLGLRGVVSERAQMLHIAAAVTRIFCLHQHRVQGHAGRAPRARDARSLLFVSERLLGTTELVRRCAQPLVGAEAMQPMRRILTGHGRYV